MTFRIERFVAGDVVVLRLCGRIQAEHVSTIEASIESEGRVAFDLEEVTMVDRDAVDFLARRERQGIELRNCPAFLREWITRA